MKRINYILVFLIVTVFAIGCGAGGPGSKKATAGVEDFKYKPKGKHKGGNKTPEEAYAMMKKDPKHTFLVDVRTRYEYMDIGHPVGAYNIPWKFYVIGKVSKKKVKYAKVPNKNFCADLKARFNPETDTLLLLCRSAKRTIKGTSDAVDCGFKKSFNVLGGFEGDKAKAGTDKGKRVRYGWRLEGLPWTYKMKKKLMYAPDVAGI